MEITGIATLLILIADIWAIIRIVGSGADTLEKLIWVIIVIVFPLIGLIAWWFIGPGGSKP